MAELLGTGEQKIISTKKIISQEGQLFTYEIVVNGTIQKEVYERLFLNRSKETEVKGFRKGEAPRELVEPQIYSEVVKDVMNLMVNYGVEELLSDEQIIATQGPEVDKVDFVLLETPIKFTVKIHKLPDYKLPDTKKLQVKAAKVEVTEEDVKKAKENLWSEWNKKAKEEEKKEFPEVSDAWVEQKVGIPKVKTVKELEQLMREELEHAKVHQEEDKLVGETLDKAIESMKIEVPPSIATTAIERTMKSQEEQMKKYGITFADYLKHYNKTEDDFKKEVTETAEKRFREDVFWTLYIKDRKITIDPKNSKDIVFINYAASMMQIKPDAKLTQKQVEVIMQTAAMYKAVQVFREEIGLKPHEEPSVEVSDEAKK